VDVPGIREPEFPGYEITSLLGRGAASSIFRARQVSTGQLVALKIFDEGEFVGLAQTEVEALVAISGHPFAVRLIDSVTGSSGGRAIALELLDGPDGGRATISSPLSQKVAIRTAIEIGSAIETLHANGYVHGDIKPSNIVLTAAGAKLVDFGLARPLAPDGTTDRANGLTIAWAAPEAFRDGRGFSSKSDVYSLALTLFTFLTGKIPLWRSPDAIAEGGAPSIAELVKGIYLGFEEVVLPQARDAIDPDLVQVITYGAEIEPNRRPSISEFVELLRDFERTTQDDGRDPFVGVVLPPDDWTAEERRSLVYSTPPPNLTISIAAVNNAADFAPVAAGLDRFIKARSATKGERREESGLSPLVVAVMTALPLEQLAILKHLKNKKSVVSALGASYVFGTFTSREREWIVASTCVGQGNIATAVLAQQTAIWLRPDLLSFVGIAGGIKDVVVGDVVVASKVIGYETSKVARRLLPRADVRNVSSPLIQHFTAIGLSKKWKSRVPFVHRGKNEVFVKPIAAGEKVLADSRSETMKAIRAFHSEAIAVEMEGLGLLVAADYPPETPAVVIRGISDLLDNKDQSDLATQPMAAAVAAALFFEGLATLEPRQLKVDIQRDPGAQAVLDNLTILFRGDRA
jgi:serine/threonine protein kinase/nucleoside phosphorylase